MLPADWVNFTDGQKLDWLVQRLHWAEGRIDEVARNASADITKLEEELSAVRALARQR